MFTVISFDISPLFCYAEITIVKGTETMEKYIPYEKLSKKEQRKVNAARRNTWGEINPVTRKPQNSKAYNRNKARRWKRETHETNAGAYFIESRYIFCGTFSRSSKP